MSEFSKLFADYARIVDEIGAAATRSNGPTSALGIELIEVLAALRNEYDNLTLCPEGLTAAVLGVGTEAPVPIRKNGAAP